ncbi:MAG: hypothetical protein WCH43_05580 [Verrucomicrobiota bacterium]
MKTLRCLAMLLLALSLAGFAQKHGALSVTFHVETNARDTSTFAVPVNLINLKRQAFIEKMPSITEREISGIFPFPASDGTMGCAFKLDDHGRVWLDTLSIEKKGMALVAMVNGRIVCDMLIDKRVADGIISIPNGLTNEDITILKKKFKVIGTGKPAKPTGFERMPQS